jgi:hypothetical protein
MAKIIKYILQSIFILLSTTINCYAVNNFAKLNSLSQLSGIWKGNVQFINHNSRYKDPSYYKMDIIILSIDKKGRLIGRTDNDCYFDGFVTSGNINNPAKLDVKLYRCQDNDMNRRFFGNFNSKGEFKLSWEMMDDVFPVVVRASGKLYKDQ